MDVAGNMNGRDEKCAHNVRKPERKVPIERLILKHI